MTPAWVERVARVRGSMHILGISCFYHDAAAALIRDGRLVAAAEEERFSRTKHDFGFPTHAIDFCLRTAGIQAQDLDYVVFYEKPLLKFERILLSSLATAPRSVGFFRDAMATWFSEKLWVKSLLVGYLKVPANKVLFIDHHMSHAASAFFCSPYQEAAILTIDGVGEWTTTAMGHATADWSVGEDFGELSRAAPEPSGDGTARNHITLDREMRFPHSLGLLYSSFTAWLGFRVNNGEYKVMGMAPYGDPKYVDKVEKLIDVAADGSFALDMSYFSFHHSTTQTYNQRFVDLFGPPYKPGDVFVTDRTHPDVLIGDGGGVDRATRERNQYYADVAASIQLVTEETILRLARHAYKLTGSENLCMAGGVALNSVANGRIVREGPFKSVFIQPAAGDSGGALGAALYAYHVLLGQPRQETLEHAYWGAEYADAEVADFLHDKGVPYRQVHDDRLFDELVNDLTHARVIGWCQGRFEWGPRALGNRSILADPRRLEMKEIVNSKIKFREPFRPFAPAVLESPRPRVLHRPQPGSQHPGPVHVVGEPSRRRETGGIARHDPHRRHRPAANRATGLEPALSRPHRTLWPGHRRAGLAQHILQPARRAYRQHTRKRLQHLCRQRHRRPGAGQLHPAQRRDGRQMESCAKRGSGGLMRQLLGLVLLTAFYFILAVVAAEGWLRLFDGAAPAAPPASFWRQDDPETGWSLQADASGHYFNPMYEYDQDIRINSLGLRSPETIGYSKPADVFRVLVLGDSYVEALHVPLAASFPQLLGKHLTAGGQRVEVINAGVSGWGTDQQLLWLRSEGVKYQPDLVLLAVYPGNDFMNNYLPLEYRNFGRVLKPSFELVDGQLTARDYPFDAASAEASAQALGQTTVDAPSASAVNPPRQLLRPAGAWLHQHSALYRYLDPRLRQLRQPSPSSWGSGECSSLARKPKSPSKAPTTSPWPTASTNNRPTVREPILADRPRMAGGVRHHRRPVRRTPPRYRSHGR